MLLFLRVISLYIEILESAYHFLHKVLLKFWLGLHWIYKSILGRIDILTILSFQIHEHSISFHFFFKNFSQQCILIFLVYQFCTSFVTFTTKYFLVFNAIISVFLVILDWLKVYQLCWVKESAYGSFSLLFLFSISLVSALIFIFPFFWFFWGVASLAFLYLVSFSGSSGHWFEIFHF